MSQIPIASSPIDGNRRSQGDGEIDGPFSPPSDYAFEPELVGEVPRPIPAYVRRGRYGQRRRFAVYMIAWIGALSLMLAQLPFVQAVRMPLLPVGYLRWIGWGGVIVAGCCFVLGYFVLGNYRYVRPGSPFPPPRHRG